MAAQPVMLDHPLQATMLAREVERLGDIVSRQRAVINTQRALLKAIAAEIKTASPFDRKWGMPITITLSSLRIDQVCRMAEEGDL